ncbi:hypothetical protein GWK47_038947 [Chionoecetes opilio]|uniref:Uncharacterized protein n=1 Tax=Chionoecetes opilio TaxID=41210 RepID=A0A8J4YRF8_CHIOP|nr:hypothetical protein GWK47_038947 [Chionoecetes opilio]
MRRCKAYIWPQGLNAEYALSSRQHPDPKSWTRFQLVKVKISSDNYQECDNYKLTSAIEESSTDSDDDGEGVLKRKRKRVKKILPEDFVSSQDLHVLQNVTPAKLQKITRPPTQNQAPAPPQKLTPAPLQNVAPASPSTSFQRSVDDNCSPRPGSSHDYYKLCNPYHTKKLQHESHDSLDRLQQQDSRDQLQQQDSRDQHERHSSQLQQHYIPDLHKLYDDLDRLDRREQHANQGRYYSWDRQERHNGRNIRERHDSQDRQE